jgi:Protein of unknown function (DUF3175)
MGHHGRQDAEVDMAKKSKHKTSRRDSWVRRVRETSDAMDLPPRIFKRPPRGIAQGLEQSVLRSRRTKGTKFRSAMSMLNLYINRTGRNLSAKDRQRLEAAKDELRKVFGRAPRGVKRPSAAKRRRAGARRTRGGARHAA